MAKRSQFLRKVVEFLRETWVWRPRQQAGIPALPGGWRRSELGMTCWNLFGGCAEHRECPRPSYYKVSMRVQEFRRCRGWMLLGERGMGVLKGLSFRFTGPVDREILEGRVVSSVVSRQLMRSGECVKLVTGANRAPWRRTGQSAIPNHERSANDHMPDSFGRH